MVLSLYKSVGSGLFLYFIKNKKEASSLKIPDSIDTKNVELLYISEGHTVDIFREITPLKFPNLKKLVIDTNIVKGGKFPKFEKLEDAITKDTHLLSSVYEEIIMESETQGDWSDLHK